MTLGDISKFGNLLQWIGLGGMGVGAVGTFVPGPGETGAPEALGYIGLGTYELGSIVKDFASVGHFALTGGNASAATLGQFNDQIVQNLLPSGLSRSMASTLLDRAEEHAGFTNGDEGICK